MKVLGRPLTERERALAVVTVCVVVGTAMWRAWLLPAYDLWQTRRAAWTAAHIEHATLVQQQAAADAVAQRIAALDTDAFADATDQATLSNFLREIETRARRVQLTSVQPLPIDAGAHHRRYPVQMSLSGRLVEVVRFVDELLHGPTVVGLEAFTLRGVREGRGVECTLRLWMVRIDPRAGEPAT